MKKKKKLRKIMGSAERPRLSVYRSLNHLFAQVIDDHSGKTLVAASTLSLKKDGGNRNGAKALGLDLAKKAQSKGVKKIVFDRGEFLYHGRVKALAEALREGGLEF